MAEEKEAKLRGRCGEADKHGARGVCMFVNADVHSTRATVGLFLERTEHY